MTDTRTLVGAHLSTSRGLAAMVRTAVAIGATCAQIFTSSPQQWRAKQHTPADVEAFRAAWESSGLGPVVSHDSYLINLAGPDPGLREKSLAAFRAEIDRCGQLGLPAVVTHLGAHKESSLEDGLRRLADSLNTVMPIAEDAGVRIVLETTAGQGTYLGGTFDQFPRIFDMVDRHEALGVCLDTCHVFVAGYDLRDPDHYRALWDEFDRTIGLSRLCVIHLNDAAKPLGSHGDRHADIGEGYLGLEPFRLLMNDPRFVEVPKILETPGNDEDHARNLAVLRGLIAAS